MSARKINFVSNRQKSLGKKQEIDKKIFYVASGVFAALALFSLISLGLAWWRFSVLSKLNKESELLREEILAGEPQESAFVVLVNKLQAIADISAERKKRQDTIDYFSQVFSDKVLVQEMSYEQNQQDKMLIFDLLSNDVFTLEDVLSKINSQDLQKAYPDTEASSLERSEKGTYSLSVQVNLSNQ